jgi:hypothetical protein
VRRVRDIDNVDNDEMRSERYECESEQQKNKPKTKEEGHK